MRLRPLLPLIKRDEICREAKAHAMATRPGKSVFSYQKFALIDQAVVNSNEPFVSVAEHFN